MKKIIALSLITTMATGLVACGSTSSSSSSSSIASNSASSIKATTESEDTATTKASEEQVSNDKKSEPKYTLRFGHVLTEQDAFNDYMLQWADAVNKKTNGDVLIEIYPNSELGTEEDVIEQIRQGANIGWQTDFARLGSYVNELSVCNASYFVDNTDEVLALQKSKTIQNLNQQLADQYGIDNISFDWIQGYRNVFTNKKATNPSELKGQLIRTANAPIWIESVNALGCTATPLNYGDIYSGIQTKVVDGCELPYNSANNLKIQEVCKYVLETQHIYAMNTMIISKQWMDTLPEEYQKIIIDECNAAGLEATKALAEQTAKSKQTMIDAGIEVVPTEELDIAAFKEKSKQAYDKLGLSKVRAAVYKDIGKE